MNENIKFKYLINNKISKNNTRQKTTQQIQQTTHRRHISALLGNMLKITRLTHLTTTKLLSKPYTTVSY